MRAEHGALRRTEGLEHVDGIVRGGRQPVMAFWHGRILPATYYFRRRGIVVITSENFDGEWIAGIIERFGYATARGSTSRGGRKALLQLRREMAAGKSNAAIGETLFLTESSVEKVIHSIFQKLELTWETAIHKRVKAVVLYLAASG